MIKLYLLSKIVNLLEFKLELFYFKNDLITL